jgi:nitroreductase
MEIYEALETRRSIRKYKAPPTEDQLNRVVAAGGLAPSGFNRQGWDVIIVDDPALIEKISEVKYELSWGLIDIVDRSVEEFARRQKEGFLNAALLMVYQQVGKSEREIRYDCGGAWLLMGNICLAAIAEGLATRIVSFWDWAEEEVNKLLKVPEGKKQVSGINIGVPNEEPKPRALKPKEKWLHRNHF